MSVLLLRLSGPLQSWGSSSRFNRRTTEKEPTKSGVIGLLASAQGRSRTDSIADLLELSFAVRADQPGSVVSDLQTEHSTPYQQRQGINLKMPLSHRYYISDAKFVVALGSKNTQFLEALASALHNPKWPLYLGRRSCPPDYPVLLRMRDDIDSVRTALEEEPWQAAAWYKTGHRGADEFLSAAADAEDSESGSFQMDAPLTFHPEHRQYGTRAVHRWSIKIADLPGSQQLAGETFGGNADAPPQFPSGDHDPMKFI